MNNNLIRQLRKETGFGVMECKKALEEAGEDIKKAKKNLAKEGKVKAEEKAGRKSNQGIIESYVHNKKIGVLLELSSETDFVARNSSFGQLAHELAMQIASMNPKDIDELSGQPFIKDESLKIKDLIDQAVGRLGENIQIRRFIRYNLGGK